MRALFIKEFRQGRPLLIFAAIMAGLVPLCYLVLARAAFLYVSGNDPAWLPVIAGFAIFGVPLFIAILASAGLFSGEAHRGTLPILFALPLSRGRIWLAKVLAGLALTLTASLLVLVIGGALLPGAYRDLPIPYHLLDLCCWLVFLISVGAFCSSLSRSINAALPSTVLLAGAIIAGAATLRFYYGAPLLGPPWLDIALWCLCAAPALLLASALVVTRGELLQSARKWLFGAPVLLLCLAFTLALVVAVARVMTGYQRSAVQQLTDVTDPSGGQAVCLFSHAQPFRLVPRWLVLLFKEEWLLSGELAPDDLPLFHRANYAVTLDLTTGRELSRLRAPLDYQQWTYPSPGSASAACSRDGRLAALITQPAGLTWGVRSNRPSQLRILNVEHDTLLYQGWPSKLPSDIYGDFFEPSWSPSGEYLALSKETQGGSHGDNVMMYLLSSDGSQSRFRPLLLGSASWSPTEDVIYGLDNNDNLCRAYPDDRPNEIIWSPEPKPENVERWVSPQGLSPDGKWFGLLEGTEPKSSEPPQRRRRAQTLQLIPTDGRPSQAIWRDDSPSLSLHDAAWSGNSRFLYLVLRRRDEASHQVYYRLLCLNAQTGKTTQSGPELGYAPITTLISRPHSDEVVLWCLEYEWPREREPEARLVAGVFALADSSGGWRPLPSADESSRFAMEHKPIGFDSQGRLLLLAGGQRTAFQPEPLYRRLEALDLESGQLQQIYP